MEKRGQLVYKALLVIIACGIVVVAFVVAGKSYGSQEAFYKLAIARDLALTIDLMYGLPGNLEYVYPNDVSDYDIEAKDNMILVYSHNLGKTDPTLASYIFAGIDKDYINAEIKGTKHIKIEKVNEKIRISGVYDLTLPSAGGRYGGGGASGES